jgi:hypothetical protein
MGFRSFFRGLFTRAPVNEPVDPRYPQDCDEQCASLPGHRSYSPVVIKRDKVLALLRAAVIPSTVGTVPRGTFSRIAEQVDCTQPYVSQLAKEYGYVVRYGLG